MACLHSCSLPSVKDKLIHFSVMERGSSTPQILLSHTFHYHQCHQADWTQETAIKLPHLVLLEVTEADLQAYNRALRGITEQEKELRRRWSCGKHGGTQLIVIFLLFLLKRTQINRERIHLGWPKEKKEIQMCSQHMAMFIESQNG